MKIRLIIAWLCNLIDTAATLHLFFTVDGEELNPITAWLLQCPPVFAVVKLVVMSSAVAFIWWKRDGWLCKIASWVLCVEYLAVAVYYMIVYAVVL